VVSPRWTSDPVFGLGGLSVDLSASPGARGYGDLVPADTFLDAARLSLLLDELGVA
jgi:hypothetical protein